MVNHVGLFCAGKWWEDDLTSAVNHGRLGRNQTNFNRMKQKALL